MRKQTATNFFYHNAPYSWNTGKETQKQGHWRTARELAQAEKRIKAFPVSFEWSDDLNGCIGCDCGSNECNCYTGKPHETLCCLIRHDDSEEVLASLGGICNTTIEYQRVVMAELAQEALINLE